METRLLVVGGHLQALSQGAQAGAQSCLAASPQWRSGLVLPLQVTSSRNLRNTWCPVGGCLEEDWEV